MIVKFFKEQNNINLINCFSNEGGDWKNSKLVYKNSEIEVITDGEMNSCNLHFEVKNSGSIRVRLSGDSKWFGISITGNLHGNVNLSFAIVNDLSKNTTMTFRTLHYCVPVDSQTLLLREQISPD